MKTILFIGDIFGSPGRELVKKLIPSLKAEFKPDIIIANGENSAGGMGINEKKYKELIESGIDVVTLGNHVWHNKDFIKDIEKCPNVIRPANYPPGTPGKGMLIYKGIGIANFLGRVFMKEMDDPFRCAEAVVSELRKETPVIILDFHAEATSEKEAFGYFMDGKVSAVIGTHTHVQTADERIFPGGTAYITDAGMVGSYNSVIGVEKNSIIERFVTLLPKKFDPSKEAPFVLNAVLLKIDEISGKASEIKRIIRVEEKSGD